MDITHLQKYQFLKKKGGTEHDDIINQFLTELNNERIGKKYKKVVKGKETFVSLRPLTFMAVKMKLLAIHKDTQSLYEWLSVCKDYKNRNGSFSKIFFGATKNK